MKPAGWIQGWPMQPGYTEAQVTELRRERNKALRQRDNAKARIRALEQALRDIKGQPVVSLNIVRIVEAALHVE